MSTFNVRSHAGVYAALSSSSNISRRNWVNAYGVWGWGAYPYFGVRGPMGFGWYVGLYHAGYGWGGYRGGGPGRVGVNAGARGVGLTRSANDYHAAGVNHSSGGVSRGGFSGHAGGGHGGHR